MSTEYRHYTLIGVNLSSSIVEDVIVSGSVTPPLSISISLPHLQGDILSECLDAEVIGERQQAADLALTPAHDKSYTLWWGH